MSELLELLKSRGFEDVHEFYELTDTLIFIKGQDVFQEWNDNNGTKESLLELLK